MVKLSFPQRLDVFLAKVAEGYSRSLLQKFIKTEGVVVHGKRILKPHFLLRNEVDIAFSLASLETFLKKHSSPPLVASKQPSFSFIFENADFIVLNKPPHFDVQEILEQLNGSFSLVHRLDKGTSGLLVIAKNPVSLANLQAKWRERLVQKEYLALVKGGLSKEGRIEAKIARSFRDRKRMVVSSGQKSRDAVTEFSVLEDFGDVMLVAVRPITGRTHQIRVHFASIKHPVIGDATYGDKKLNVAYEKFGLTRQFLHASRLTFPDPKDAKQKLSFKAPLGTDLEQILSVLRG